MGRTIVRIESGLAASKGLWAGALALGGATAAVAFPTMKRLDPELGAYSVYEGEHWVLGAGHIAARVFAIAGWVELACLGLVVVLSGALALRRAIRGSSLVVRGGLLGLLVAMMAYRVGMLQPRMDSTLDAYWAAAEAGRLDEAGTARATFDADHGIASATMGATLVLILASIGAGIAMPARPTNDGAPR